MLGLNFCETCIRETTDESAGNLTCINEIGARFRTPSNDPRCNTCRSVIRQVVYTVLFPVRRGDYFRVIFMTDERFFSRKMRDTRGLR